jgi:hypothetical protein
MTRTAKDGTHKTLPLRNQLYLTLVTFIQALHQSGKTIKGRGLARREKLETAGWRTVPSWNAERPQTNVHVAILFVLEWKNLIAKPFIFQVHDFCKDRLSAGYGGKELRSIKPASQMYTSRSETLADPNLLFARNCLIVLAVFPDFSERAVPSLHRRLTFTSQVL